MKQITVFGVDLTTLMTQHSGEIGRKIPSFVATCIDYIMNHGTQNQLQLIHISIQPFKLKEFSV